jgi:hypothetical protein
VSTPAARHAHAASTVAGHTLAVTGDLGVAQARLDAFLARIRDLWHLEPPMVRRRRARAFTAEAVLVLTPLVDRVPHLTEHAVTATGLAAASAAAVDLARSPVDVTGVTGPAVKQLTADLQAAIDFYLKTARALAHAVERIAGVEGTVREQADALERTLRDRELTAVVYRDGSRHGLAEYARMATRTSLAETWQRATHTALRDVGVRYVEISDGFGCGWTRHDDPDKANGSIRPLADADAYPLAHPNCGRVSFPRVDVATDEEARAAARISRALIPDRAGAAALQAVRSTAGTLDTRALAVLAPSAARHAQMVARIRGRNVAALGARPALALGVSIAARTRQRQQAKRPGGAG